eukprot:s352_g10.t1
MLRSLQGRKQATTAAQGCFLGPSRGPGVRPVPLLPLKPYQEVQPCAGGDLDPAAHSATDGGSLRTKTPCLGLGGWSTCPVDARFFTDACRPSCCSRQGNISQLPECFGANDARLEWILHAMLAWWPGRVFRHSSPQLLSCKAP